MTKMTQIYKCNICGNIIEILHEGADALICCGKPMNLIPEKTIEEGNEKHKPLIEKNEGEVAIKVGSIEHPMEEKHFIEWIEISTKKGNSKKFLKPGEKPEVKFPVKTEITSVRSYCNIHGLWASN